MVVYGINIHFRASGPYKDVPLATQLQRVKDMGLTHLRIDVYDGGAETVARLSNLIAAATTLGLHVTPVFVEPTAAAATSESAVRSWCYAEARKLAQAFPTTWFEAGNELNFKCIKPNVTGESSADFDTATYPLVRGAIRGMVQGFKSASSCPVAVGSADIHFGFLDRLKADGVVWDITTLHTYPVAGASVADINRYAKIWFDRLKTFGKPVAVTEFNQGNGHLATNSAQTLLDTMSAMEANNVLIAYLYELLDEPGLAGGEATYGLCDFGGTLNALGRAVRDRLTG